MSPNNEATEVKHMLHLYINKYIEVSLAARLDGAQQTVSYWSAASSKGLMLECCKFLEVSW